MQIIQRMLLVLLMIFGLGFGILLLNLEQEEKVQKQWEALQIERFVGKISRRGTCTYEEYLLCHEALNYSGNTSVIAIETYQKEEDMSGEKYYYMISWEEIQEMLYRNGRFDFDEESVIVVSVSRKNKMKSLETKYYNIVAKGLDE